MKLRELLEYDNIIVQCHDNPDADSIASGFGVYTYLKMNGKKVRLIYGGRFAIKKSNLRLLVSELQIPIEYVDEIPAPELLVTVDCQYGEGNVKRFEAKEVAIIDHHQIAVELPEFSEVRSNLGACSTLVWEMMKQEGIEINKDRRLATALYYGLLTDTNNFTEISHPMDKDLRDEAAFDRRLISLFRNSNLSLEELGIAGEALLGYDYNEVYRFALVAVKPCDPNILGVISDLVMEVDAVSTCLVYSILPFGIKFSVRSCVKEVKASELAEFIAKEVGSGGGHLEKAGGFIQSELIEKVYAQYGKESDAREFLQYSMISYFKDVEVIYTNDYQIDISDMPLYKKSKIHIGYVKAAEIFAPGTRVAIRTLEGDLEVRIQKDTYIMIGIKGEVYPNRRNNFERGYRALDEPYQFEGEYAPTVKDTQEGKNISLIPYAKTCVATGESYIYAKKLDHRVKIFTEWDKEKYMLGRKGDYLAVRRDDFQDIFIIEENIFQNTYEPG